MRVWEPGGTKEISSPDMLGSSVDPSVSYTNELRMVRPGKSPRRSPVIKLGTTEAEIRANGPGPGSYSPVDRSKRSSSAWSMSDGGGAKMKNSAAAASPGPVYMMRSTMAVNVHSAMRTSPRFGFGSGVRPDAVSLARAQGDIPGPGAYYDPNAGMGGSSRSSSSSRGKQSAPYKPMDRSLGGNTLGPGPAAYSPRDVTSEKRWAPMYSIAGVAGVSENQTLSPGPAMYVTRATSRYGGGYMGDAPSPSISQRQSQTNRYVSKEHAKVAQWGLHSPGPASYTPREMVGVVNQTNSNTSRHAPMYSFGSEKRAVG